MCCSYFLYNLDIDAYNSSVAVFCPACWLPLYHLTSRRGSQKTTLHSYLTVALHCGNLSFGWHCALVMSQPVALLIAFPWPLLTVALHHSCLTFHCRQYCTMAMLIFYLLWHCTSPVLVTTAHHDGCASISTKHDLVPQSCLSLPCLQHIALLPIGSVCG